MTFSTSRLTPTEVIVYHSDDIQFCGDEEYNAHLFKIEYKGDDYWYIGRPNPDESLNVYHVTHEELKYVKNGRLSYRDVTQDKQCITLEMSPTVVDGELRSVTCTATANPVSTTSSNVINRQYATEAQQTEQNQRNVIEAFKAVIGLFKKSKA